MKRHLRIEGFKADQNEEWVEIRPIPRDRHIAISIRKPRRVRDMRTGRLRWELARVQWGSFSQPSIRETVRYAKALVAAAFYAMELNFEAKRVPK